ncbi:hypothetical protein MF672_007735 [Actinomadura sp. ATCC 31491]|uniref:Zinc ribbon domain-containing protein n=1 Tax=Actinomadura luzonensis TaxID=2805427 RepID=A0ABT0FMV8_9ACTN|nr:hypothetical protein [Actinomadura luzonensis]MCK2213680.1 hypothetical protein [Actinomadura luzonensis]
MQDRQRSYRYAGPAHLKTAIRADSAGHPIRSRNDFDDWIAERTPAELAEPFTFVVDMDGVLRLAPRRSEHVACAGGGPVLSAGEISFSGEAGRWTVVEVSNHSTGYCPDTSSWTAVAAALDRACLGYPPGFTQEVVFRRCPTCQERNIVREDDFVCVFCGSDLPALWNVDSFDESP